MKRIVTLSLMAIACLAVQAQDKNVIVLAQGSMAYAEQAIYEAIQKPVLSSPRFGAAALAQALSVKERKTC